jgi:DNA polymerase sigma
LAASHFAQFKMKRQDAPAPKRRKSRGRRKSKAERLARSAPIDATPDDLHALLQGSSSREWDAAQSLALRIGTPDARATVVRTILAEREAPRAAAHYAKRLGMRGDELLAAATTGASSPLLLAQFLVELDERALPTPDRLRCVLWPWLLQVAIENVQDKAALKAAVHLMLHPTASDDAKVQDKRERGRRLQRATVAQCLRTGKLLHLVPMHARAFSDTIEVGCSEAAMTDDVDDDADEAMESERQRRHQVARRVQNVLRLMWPDARVLVFGSSATGLLSVPEGNESNSPADVDLCALLPSAPQFRQDTAPLVTEAKEHLTLYLLPDTAGEDMTAVTRARIPIVHFQDPATHLPCDLCVNNVPALWNTRLLRRLLYGRASADPDERKQLEHVRRFCKWLRMWRQAKKHVVGGALSSYGLMLLALYYLQRLGVLPVLDCSSLSVEDEPSLRTLTEDEIDKRLDKVDPRCVSGTEGATEGARSWQELRRGFFRFYMCEFDYEHTVVSLRTPDVMLKSSKGWSRQNDTRLCLEDPVELERDLGALCSHRAFGRLRCAFAHACVVLSNQGGEEEQSAEATSAKQAVEADLLASWAYEDDNAQGEGEAEAADSHGTVN